MKRIILAIAAIVSAAHGAAVARTAGDGLIVERIALVMRHGVRPPTKDPAMPPGIAADPWPRWDVQPGELTSHGAKAVTLLGAFDRAVVAASVLARGSCPAPGSISVSSDSDQRTIATADAWIEGFAPGCAVANHHKPQGENDPLFSPLGTLVTFDPARADAAVRQELGAGGLAAVEARNRDVLARLDRIYCGPEPHGPCGVSRASTRLAPPCADRKPGFEGALDLGSTAGQILLLEYADGKPMSEVGWGRASTADIAAVSALHAVEYSVLVRPHYVAASIIAPVMERLLAALTDRTPGAPALTLIVGHDTQVAALGGLLDLHWQAPGIARDDPPPGGALGFVLMRDPNGRRFVRAIFRAQSLDEMRRLAPLSAAHSAAVTILPIPGCAAATPSGCPLGNFTNLVRERIAR